MNQYIRWVSIEVLIWRAVAIIFLFACLSSASFSLTTGGTNILSNGGFESGSGTDATDWTESSIERVSSGCRTGSYCLSSISAPSITNPSFESAIGTEWTCQEGDGSGCSSFTRTQSYNPEPDGVYAVSGSPGDETDYVIIQQAITVSANTAYNFTAYLWDTDNNVAPIFRIRTDSYTAGSNLCSVSPPASEFSQWSAQLTCTVPNSNTDTSLYIQILSPTLAIVDVGVDKVEVSVTSSAVTSAYSASTYSYLRVEGYAKGAGTGYIRILDQSDSVLCSDSITLTGSYQLVDVSCGKGSATSIKIKIENGTWDDIDLRNEITLTGISSGQKVEIYDTTGAVTSSGTSVGTSIELTTIISGSYFWRITSADSSTFLDSSGWVTVNSGDTWAWSNSNLTSNDTWDFEERGSAGAYYRTIKRNSTSDYIYQSMPIGSNLASGKVTYSSSLFTHLLSNQSFESDWTGWTNLSCGGVCTIATDRSNDGSKALKFTAPTSSSAIVVEQSVSVTANQNYYVSWMAFNTMTAGNQVLQIADNAKALLCQTSATRGLGEWQVRGVGCNVGSNTTIWIRIYINNATGNTGDAWFDAILLCQSSSACDGRATNATDGTNLRWVSVGTNQWITIDLGSAQTFNAIHIVSRNNEGYGYNGISVKYSSDNTSFTEITTASRLQYDDSVWIYFADQSYRYVRIEATSSYTRTEAQEIEIYRMQDANSYGDIEEISAGSGTNAGIMNGITYASKVTNSDESVTYTKSGITVPDGTVTIDTTYKQFGSTWRKAVQITTNFTGYIGLRNILSKNTSSVKHNNNAAGTRAMLSKDHTQDDITYSTGIVGGPSCSEGSCTQIAYQPFQLATICLPECFGLSADDGWNGKWQIINGTTPSGIKESLEVTGTKIYGNSNWNGAYNQYGKRDDGYKYIPITSGTPITLYIYHFFSKDPAYYATALRGISAVADGKGFTTLDDTDKINLASAYQNIRIRSADDPQLWAVSGPGYSYQGAFQSTIFTVWGIGNQEIGELFYTLIKKVCNRSGAVSYSDTLNCSDDLLWLSDGLSLPFSYYLNKKHGTSVNLTLVRDRLDEIESLLASNGCWKNPSTGSDGRTINDIYNISGQNIANLDMCDTHRLMQQILELRSGKALLPSCGSAPCWSSTDDTYLATSLTKVRTIFDSSDGVIRVFSGGHWFKETGVTGAYNSDVFSSADYIYAEGSTGVSGALSRFVVPGGYSGASVTYQYKKSPSAGKMIVRKCNPACSVIDTIDQYNATVTVGSSVLSSTVNSGDALIFVVANTKNASSTGYRASIDRLEIGAIPDYYDEDNSNWVCAGGYSDCSNGYTRGFDRWINASGKLAMLELMYRALFNNENMFLNADIITHFNNLQSNELSEGSLFTHNTLGNGDYIPDVYYNDYYETGFYHRDGEYNHGGSYLAFDLAYYELLVNYTNAEEDGVYYQFQEGANRIQYSGTWTTSSKISSANNTSTSWPYRNKYKYSNTNGNSLQFTFKGMEIYWVATKDAGYGTADVYFCSGENCTPTLDTANISLSNVSTLHRQTVYSKTGLTYGWHTIKIQLDSSSTVTIDMLKIKTRPSWLYDIRKALEIAVRPLSHEFICATADSGCYGDSQIQNRKDSHDWNIFYRGGVLTNYPSWRGIFEGLYYRRVN